jgi:hypothetical protein
MKLDPALATQSLSLHGQVDQICDVFESAWRAGKQPNIRDFLAPQRPDSTIADPAARRLLLQELIKIDLEHRWRHAARSQPCEHNRGSTDGRSSEAATETGAGAPCLLIGNYIDLFPELGSLSDLPVELIAEEYRARHRWGDRPDHAGYARRFMHHGAPLLQVLERIDEELGSEKARMEIRVYDNRELVHRATFTGSVELGRQEPEDANPYSHSRAEHGCRMVIARLEEQSISRRHARLEPLGDGRIRVSNLSSNRSIILHDGTRLVSGDNRVVVSPVVLTVGSKAVRVRG